MNDYMKEEIKKKILTATIGSLSKFEKFFGYLWGHGKDELTEQEEYMRDLWEDTRYEILNLGNQQIRQLNKILSQFNYRYQYNFKMRNNNEET